MKTIFFAHSAGAQYAPGKGSYDLVKYLKGTLRATHKIHSPVISKPNTPAYAKYKKMYASFFGKLTGPVTLIGHSLGASTLVKYLSEEQPALAINGLYLVSTPFWESNMAEFQLKEHFESALAGIHPIFLYHSKKDRDVPFDHLNRYKSALHHATARALPGTQHLFSHGLSELVADINQFE